MPGPKPGALPLGDTPTSGIFNSWLGWQDSNLRVIESKSIALPLGDTPKQVFKINGVEGGSRTHDLKIHNLAL